MGSKMIHGIAIREKATGKLEEFTECECGKEALMFLSGMRHNLNTDDYDAQETLISQVEYDEYKRRST
jgi:hypothetical protein